MGGGDRGRDVLLGRLRRRILGFAVSRVGPDDGEDLTQDVFVVLEGRYGHVDRLEELVPLAMKILRNKLMSLHAKRGRRGPHLPLQGSGPEAAEGGRSAVRELVSTSDDPERRAELRQLREAIAQLGDRCRRILHMRLEGWSFGEIQQAVGAATLNTVYTWDHRCRQQLRELLFPAGGER